MFMLLVIDHKDLHSTRATVGVSAVTQFVRLISVLTFSEQSILFFQVCGRNFQYFMMTGDSSSFFTRGSFLLPNYSQDKYLHGIGAHCAVFDGEFCYRLHNLRLLRTQ